VSGRHGCAKLMVSVICVSSARPGRLCQIDGGSGIRCSVTRPKTQPANTNKARKARACSYVKDHKPAAQQAIDKGRRIISELASARDPPPIEKVVIIKAQRSQSCHDVFSNSLMRGIWGNENSFFCRRNFPKGTGADIDPDERNRLPGPLYRIRQSLNCFTYLYLRCPACQISQARRIAE
jgi:hypothetical protein